MPNSPMLPRIVSRLDRLRSVARECFRLARKHFLSFRDVHFQAALLRGVLGRFPKAIFQPFTSGSLYRSSLLLLRLCASTFRTPLESDRECVPRRLHLSFSD